MLLPAAGVRRSAGAAAGAGALRRTVGEEGLVLAARFRGAVAFRVAFREPLFRAPAALLRVAPVRFFDAPARFRLAAALRFRLAPALRLRDAARLVFFLPRGGILLLRELGSQSAAGVANSLPAFVNQASHVFRASTSASPPRTEAHKGWRAT